MAKFRYLKEWVDREVANTQLFKPTPCPMDLLQSVHDSAYVEAFQNGTLDPKAIREIGLPWSPGLATRTRLALGGSVYTCELACQYGLASHLAAVPIMRTRHGARDFVSTMIWPCLRRIWSPPVEPHGF